MNLDDVLELSTRLGPVTVFGTVDNDGTPHTVPVVPRWWDGSRLVFASRAGSLKVRNLATRTSASMHFATPGEGLPDEALLIKGAARVVADVDERTVYWFSGLFPILPMMHSGPEDPGLRFVEFTPRSAVVVRGHGRGPIERWQAQAHGSSTSAAPDLSRTRE